MVERITFQNGKITIGEGEERYILIPMRAYVEILNTMHKLVGEAMGAPLYYLGKKIGRGLVEELSKRMQGKEQNIKSLVEEYVEYLEKLGFGKIEVLEVSDNHATIKMLSPPSMAGIKLVGGVAEELLKQGKKICYLETGMMVAVFEEILGGKFRGIEKEHGSLDNPYCIIEVTRIS